MSMLIRSHSQEVFQRKTFLVKILLYLTSFNHFWLVTKPEETIFQAPLLWIKARSKLHYVRLELRRK